MEATCVALLTEHPGSTPGAKRPLCLSKGISKPGISVSSTTGEILARVPSITPDLCGQYQMQDVFVKVVAKIDRL